MARGLLVNNGRRAIIVIELKEEAP